MKNCIITPTFSGHFPFIPDYLKSFSKLAMDKNNFEICFTISKSEAKDFDKIVAPFKDLNIHVLFFEDILEKFGVSSIPDKLLLKYGKFSFQTLKKFYTMLYMGPDYRFLVLDSESILLKKCNINSMFDDFFAHPFISYSDMNKRLKTAKFMGEIKTNTAFILQSEKVEKLWFLENFVWFYDYKILNDMFTKYGSPFDLINKVYKDAFGKRNVGVFEIDLYQCFVYLNRKKYKYDVFDVDAMLEKATKADLYRKELVKRWGGNCGILERATSILNAENIKGLAKQFKENHFNIIRVNETSLHNYKYQKAFLKVVDPYILAASQDHMFGVKDVFKRRLYQVAKNSGWEKLVSHATLFIKPVAHFLQWLYQPIYLIINTLIFIVKFLLRITFVFKK